MSDEQTTTATTADRRRRKVRTGVVVSDSMDKTVLVRIDRKVTHPLYRKTVRRSSKLAAHDEQKRSACGRHGPRDGNAPDLQEQAVAGRRDRRTGQVSPATA